MQQPGEYDCFVTITKPAEGEDAYGQPATGFVPHDEAWANIRHQGGLEAIRAGAETSIVRASVRLFYRTDLTPSMRLAHEGTVYEVKAVLPDEARRRHVDLVCEVIR